MEDIVFGFKTIVHNLIKVSVLILVIPYSIARATLKLLPIAIRLGKRTKKDEIVEQHIE